MKITLLNKNIILPNAVNSGWAAARMTLANERISMSSGSTYGIGVESLLKLAHRLGDAISPGTVVRVGTLLAEAQSISLMAHRSTLLALAGSDPGPAAGLRKMLGAEHEQRLQELGLSMLGAEGATTEGRSQRWIQGLLFTGLVLVFMFFRPQGLVPANDIWRAVPLRNAGEPR